MRKYLENMLGKYYYHQYDHNYIITIIRVTSYTESNINAIDTKLYNDMANTIPTIISDSADHTDINTIDTNNNGINSSISNNDSNNNISNNDITNNNTNNNIIDKRQLLLNNDESNLKWIEANNINNNINNNDDIHDIAMSTFPEFGIRQGDRQNDSDDDEIVNNDNSNLTLLTVPIVLVEKTVDVTKDILFTNPIKYFFG